MGPEMGALMEASAEPPQRREGNRFRNSGRQDTTPVSTGRQMYTLRANMKEVTYVCEAYILEILKRLARLARLARLSRARGKDAASPHFSLRAIAGRIAAANRGIQAGSNWTRLRAICFLGRLQDIGKTGPRLLFSIFFFLSLSHARIPRRVRHGSVKPPQPWISRTST
jgi:hypothetical protein